MHNPLLRSTAERVIRFDSLSKTLSSGLRVGWVTAPNALMKQLEMHQQVCIHVPKDNALPTLFFYIFIHSLLWVPFTSFSPLLSSHHSLAHAQATSLHNSGISQALTAKLLAHLGPQGLDNHFRDVRHLLLHCSSSAVGLLSRNPLLISAVSFIHFNTRACV
jgi:DNA-binding transcriptional MocR family regulator